MNIMLDFYRNDSKTTKFSSREYNFLFQKLGQQNTQRNIKLMLNIEIFINSTVNINSTLEKHFEGKHIFKRWTLRSPRTTRRKKATKTIQKDGTL